MCCTYLSQFHVKNLVKIYYILKTELSVPDHIYVIIDYNTIARPVEEYLAPHMISSVLEVVTTVIQF